MVSIYQLSKILGEATAHLKGGGRPPAPLHLNVALLSFLQKPCRAHDVHFEPGLQEVDLAREKNLKKWKLKLLNVTTSRLFVHLRKERRVSWCFNGFNCHCEVATDRYCTETGAEGKVPWFHSCSTVQVICIVDNNTCHRQKSFR